MASCIQIVIRSKTLFLKHPKSRTSPVPNFFHTVVEGFWYWGRSNVWLMFCLKSFSEVKFYNSSPMYIRYTVIVPPSSHRHIVPSRNTRADSPNQPKNSSPQRPSNLPTNSKLSRTSHQTTVLVFSPKLTFRFIRPIYASIMCKPTTHLAYELTISSTYLLLAPTSSHHAHFSTHNSGRPS